MKIAPIAALVLLAAAHASFAQDQARPLMSGGAAAERFAAAQAMELRRDEQGAFVAYLDAAESGYPPAQRRLGEIYDSGNSAVKRNYEESIRWYQKARDGGEQIPPPKSSVPSLNSP